MRVRPFLIALFFSFGFDQFSKWFVIFYLNLLEYRQIEVLAPLLTFKMGWNRGINFGLFADNFEGWGVWVMIALSVLIPAGFVLWARHRVHNPWHWGALGLLSGGALGNALDRFRYGAVADFLNVSFYGVENPYIFNFADCFIFAGVLGMIFIKTHAETKPTHMPEKRE